MKKPAYVLEVFLQPGEYFFGDHETRLRTILGSCVSVTFWHPKLLLGGMCHIMLPSRSSQSGGIVDGKYADEAIELLLAEINKAGTFASEYQVKVFGGGDMFTHQNAINGLSIGQKNIVTVRNLLAKNQFNIHAEHLGGSGHRYIIFDVWSGYVWVRHHALNRPVADLAAA
jgi:chemotaxis protein CheD